MFSGNTVQYLRAPSSPFSWSWLSKKNPGESTSSLLLDKHHSLQHSWSPDAPAPAPAWASRRACWFHLLWHGGRWGQCAVLCCTVQSVRTWWLYLFSIPWKKKNKKDVRTSWSPPLPVFGDRKKLLSPLSLLQIWKWTSTGLHVAQDITQVYSLGLYFSEKCDGFSK